MEKLALLELQISELEYYSSNEDSDKLDEDPIFMAKMLQVDNSIQKIRKLINTNRSTVKLGSKTTLQLYNCERRLFGIQQILLI